MDVFYQGRFAGFWSLSHLESTKEFRYPAKLPLMVALVGVWWLFNLEVLYQIRLFLMSRGIPLHRMYAFQVPEYVDGSGSGGNPKNPTWFK